MSQSIYPGITVAQAANGATVLRLMYDADPDKAAGPYVYEPSLKMEMSSWLKREYDKMTDKALFRQEYLVDGSATLGALVYQLDDEATLEQSFPIPENWTRYFSLDPHPAVPHAMLWCAVDPWGDRWYFREYWPSKVYGKPGLCPEGDNRAPIKDYVDVLKYLESADNPQNQDKQFNAFDERVHKRVIDYAARAFGKGTSDDPEQPNYQQRFEQHMREKGVVRPFFDDAKKDHEAGEDVVNAGLKPRLVTLADGKVHKRSAIHIFADRCPELVYELKNVRRQQLTPVQAERMDPTGKAIEVRKHMVDNLRYIEMANPKYIDPTPQQSTWSPNNSGFSY